MAKRGDLARESVKDTIVNAFSATGDYVAIVDKKIYVQAQDGPGGEVLQFAISMTMPKVPVAAGEAPSGASTPAKEEVNVELSASDKEKVADLMRKLGIND